MRVLEEVTENRKETLIPSHVYDYPGMKHQIKTKLQADLLRDNNFVKNSPETTSKMLLLN